MGFFTVLNDTNYCLSVAGIQAIATQGDMLNFWTKATSDKTTSWLTGTNSTLDGQIDSWNNDTSASTITDWIAANCPGKGTDNQITDWSAAIGQHLLQKITSIAGSKTGDDATKYNGALGAASPWINAISSYASQDESEGNSQEKTMSSEIQTTVSNLSVNTDTCSAQTNTLNGLGTIMAS